MSTYKLTFTVTIEEQDDPAARKQAKEISAAISKVISDTEMKLQQVYTDQPPGGIRLG
jgi:hypothetical protein